MFRRPLARYVPPILLIATCTGCPEEKPHDSALAGDMPAPDGPDIDVSPSSVDFGYVMVGETSTAEVDVCNQGTEDLHVQYVSLEGGEPFSLGSMSAVLIAPMDCATMEVVFAPESIDTFADTVVVDSDDEDEPEYELAVQGQGVGED